MKRLGALVNIIFFASAVFLVLGIHPVGAEGAKKFKIFLSMSYTGNDWQSENANMLQAMAKTKTYRDKVDLQVQVAGASAQVQSQQITSMVQAGANAIVVFPISPTGINNAVKGACSKGVIVIAYAADIDEPCAYIVTMDEKQVGPVTGQWLADELHGKGRIVLVTGVAGTSVDADRTNGAKALRKISRLEDHRRSQRQLEPAYSSPGTRQGRSNARLGWHRRTLDAGRLLHGGGNAARSGHRR
jgi:ABC-type sugar transport system substrate-binding protein